MTLISGATGIVGAHILLYLMKEGKKVRAMKQKSSDVNPCLKLFKYHNAEYLFDKIEWIDANINNPYELQEAFIGIQEVYHAAGFVSFFPNDKYKLLKINIEGTANMVNLALENNVQKFCHISSIAVLSDKNEAGFHDETSKFNYKNSESYYAYSKYEAELEVFRAKEEGLNVLILNPSVILAPKFWQKSSAELYDKCKKSIFYTSGEIDLVDALTVAKSAILLMDSNKVNERFIISEGAISYQKLIETIKKTSKIYFISDRKLKIIAKINYVLHFLGFPFFLDENMIKTLTSSSKLKNTKIKNTISFSLENPLKMLEKYAFMED